MILKYHKKCTTEIENNNEKICRRFSDTVSHVIDFTAYSLFWDYPPTWALTKTLSVGFLCPSGSYCSDHMTIEPCPIGFYCPTNSSSPLPCSAGSYQNHPGQSYCKNCLEKYYCPNSTVSLPCPTGHFCKANSTVPTPCRPGKFKNNGNWNRCKASAEQFSSIDNLIFDKLYIILYTMHPPICCQSTIIV